MRRRTGEVHYDPEIERTLRRLRKQNKMADEHTTVTDQIRADLEAQRQNS